ncbi:MAG TPA: acetylornithine/succinylornithine family transaminase [Vicinamibacteria bacterium]|nr:acetylornithine/succinylornithine family transaminase [Vicinamibacteria bacterium]
MRALLGVYERDLVLVSGKGARLTDVAGRTYLDFAAGIGVNGLGHGDKTVVAAIRTQAGRLIHTSNLYHSEAAASLAERLVALSFPSKVFLCNSGTESVEAALKFARKIGRPAGRTEFVAFEKAFHGRTMGSLSLTWAAKYREPFEPLVPGVRFAAFNDLSSARENISEKTAAVVVEPVQGEGGVRVATVEFLQGLAVLCRERGALLIADEVQCGLGRTGRLFAYEHAGIVPDILTLAKPLGGGLPLGAVLLRDELSSAIEVGDHGSTFGGNPVAAAAALAVLARLTSQGFLERVVRNGERLCRGLRRLARKHGHVVREVRGLGLMVGLELRGDAGAVFTGLREHGILAAKAGDHVLRLLPPLVIKPGDIDVLLSTLDTLFAEGAGAAAQG